MEHSKVAQAAAVERQAEQTRKQAEDRWRLAWWGTTLALAEPEQRRDVTAALDEAERILGQSRKYLMERRAAGRSFRRLEPLEIRLLPPRMAISWAKVHTGQQADESTVAELREADKGTFDEYAAKIGEPYMDTRGNAELFVAQLPPERKASIVREALNDPDVAVRTLRDSHTRRVVSDAREQVAQEIEDAARDRQQASPVQREVAQTSLRFEISHLLRVGRFKIAEAAKLLVDLEDRDEDSFEDDVQDAQDAVDWFKSILRGGKVDDNALAKLLEGGSS
jgi:Family of unknown function (DUF6192)